MPRRRRDGGATAVTPTATVAPAVRIAGAAPRALLPLPVVVIHGGPASNILDLYPTTPDEVFTLHSGFVGFPGRKQKYDRLPMHPDDEFVTLNADGKILTPARLAAIHTFYLPYEDLVEVLKKDVGTEDQPAPVFPMAYDWRFDSLDAVPTLNAFITEVLRIVARLPEYKAAPPTEVDIVAHSYGGLVTARYLRWCQQQAPAVPARVRKVVTIATPFRGAVDALYAMIKDQKQKEAVRTLPSGYGLLPYFPDACVDITGDPPIPPPIDLLTNATIWRNSSVEKSLQAYCTRMGSTKTGDQRLNELRGHAQTQRTDLAGLRVTAALQSPDNWLPIVGIGNKTNVQITVKKKPDGTDAEFDFDKDNKGDRTGDNTVPFLGAIPAFNLATGQGGSQTPRERLVCIEEDDADMSERASWFGAAQGLGLASLHSFLPQMDRVQAIIVGFLRQNTPRFKAKAHPAPGVLPANVNWPDSWNLTAE